MYRELGVHLTSSTRFIARVAPDRVAPRVLCFQDQTDFGRDIAELLGERYRRESRNESNRGDQL
jgi:hypothetical protein